MKNILKIALLALILGTIPLFLTSSPYFTGIMITLVMMAALATSWNLLGGYAGQYSFGHTAYFGTGAYTTAILINTYQANPLVGVLAGTVIASVVALLTGSIVFRLKGHYFGLASIAVAEIVRLCVLNVEFTGGAQGIMLSDVQLFNLDLNSKLPFYYGMLAVLIAALGVSAWLQKSKTGYYLQAIREDQDAAASLGINLAWYKNKALLISAVLTSILGSVYAVYIRFIDTHAVLELHFSIEIILIAIIGGVGTLWGPVLGAALLVPLAELLRANVIGAMLVKLGLITDASVLDNLAHAHVLIYGIITVLCILYLPKGLIGTISKFKKQGA